VSVGFGSPSRAGAVTKEVGNLYHGPQYLTLFLALGCAFVIGQAFVLSSWLLGVLLTNLIIAPGAIFRMVFGTHWLYRWYGKHQGMPPNRAISTRVVGKLIFLARDWRRAEPANARVIRTCLGAAVEKLLEPLWD